MEPFSLIDTHCHLDLLAEQVPLQSVLEQAKKANIESIIVPAVSRVRWSLLQEFESNSAIDIALGLHPCFKHQQTDISALADMLSQYSRKKNSSLAAVGECGLDGVEGKADLAEQKRILMAQLELAQQYQLPVIFHVRKAHNELLSILKSFKLPAGGVIHAFSGSLEIAQQYIRHGLFLGVGGVITYPRAAKTRKAVAQLPLEWLLLETDSPDMPLNGFQGQPNTPAQIRLVLAELAKLRGLAVEHLAAIVYRNTQRCFPSLAR